jgi:hypothetical protein
MKIIQDLLIGVVAMVIGVALWFSYVAIALRFLAYFNVGTSGGSGIVVGDKTVDHGATLFVILLPIILGAIFALGRHIRESVLHN